MGGPFFEKDWHLVSIALAWIRIDKESGTAYWDTITSILSKVRKILGSMLLVVIALHLWGEEWEGGLFHVRISATTIHCLCTYCFWASGREGEYCDP